LLEAIRETRIDRNQAIAEFNETQAGLYAVSVVYASDLLRVLSDPSVSIRSKLIDLANLTAGVLLKQSLETVSWFRVSSPDRFQHSRGFARKTKYQSFRLMGFQLVRLATFEPEYGSSDDSHGSCDKKQLGFLNLGVH
jgi:hypothetical protein